jgi:hypothetical protein
VTHTKEVVTESGIKVTRLRFKRGWTSLVNSTGTSTLMVAEVRTAWIFIRLRESHRVLAE